jgi:hypothetical protein
VKLCSSPGRKNLDRRCCRLSSKVFEKRVLRRLFGPKSDEIIGGWRKLHIEERLNLYSCRYFRLGRKMRWVGHVACMGDEIIRVHTNIGRTPRRKEAVKEVLEGPRRRRDLKGWAGGLWVGFTRLKMGSSGGLL